MIEFTSRENSNTEMNIEKLMLQLFRRFEDQHLPHRICWRLLKEKKGAKDDAKEQGPNTCQKVT